MAGCRPAHPLPETGRRGQPEPEEGNHYPREASSTKLQAGFVVNQGFLGFWTAGIRQEGRSRRSAPQKRNRHTWKGAPRCTPRKGVLGRGGDKTRSPTGGDCFRQALGHLSCSDLGRAQNAGPTEPAPLWSTREPEPERLRPGECTQPRAGHRQVPEERPGA